MTNAIFCRNHNLYERPIYRTSRGDLVSQFPFVIHIAHLTT